MKTEWFNMGTPGEGIQKILSQNTAAYLLCNFGQAAL